MSWLLGPIDREVSHVVREIATKVIAMLRERGYLPETSEELDVASDFDPIIESSEQLLSAIQASTTMHIAFGTNQGKRVRRIGRGFGFEGELIIDPE